jgi:signal transduction histidine kinase
MLSRLISADIEMVLDLEEDLPLVEADPSQMSQVLVNLAVNARDAMPSGGVLAFATRREGDVAVLSVADTGVGMDEQTRVRIFEPFFTTKPIGEGTGLGLATVYGIVTQSGGSIDVASALGTGSTFTIRLPATTRAGSVADASTPMARVLVADELRR